MGPPENSGAGLPPHSRRRRRTVDLTACRQCRIGPQGSVRSSGGTPAIASESVENYLKAVYELEEDQGRVATTALAERLRVASPSVTAMLKRLSQQEPSLVDYAAHRGVTLTHAGRQRALQIIRHHRLIETFLYEVLEYTWDEVHEEAERLEHYISELFEERIARYLGDPEFDPHGSPIPTREGIVPQNYAVPLTRLAEGQSARVVRVVHPQQAAREYLQQLGIVADAIVSVVEKAPFEGPVYIRIAGKVHGIGVRVAEKVQVEATSGARIHEDDKQ